MTELPPHATPVDRIAPGTTIREWEVVRFLGRGSYGVVFEAKRSSWLHEPHRALKVFDPIVSAAARSALLSEFGALTGVRHPHLLAGIDAFDLTEPPFAGCVVFVLELAEEDLSHRVARAGALAPAEVAAIGAQVADGLSALHAEGRIHGDVKPENVLRAGTRWALGDFGVSGLLEGSYAVTAGATIDYRPPELARAEEGTRLHRSADIWALGVTLHVAAAARHPFPGPDPIMRFAAAVRDDRQPAPDLDPTLARIVDEGCLAADPRHRLDAPTLADQLRAWPSPPPLPPREESVGTPSLAPHPATSPAPGAVPLTLPPAAAAAAGASPADGAAEESVGSLPLAPPGDAGAFAVPPLGAPVAEGGPASWSPSSGALPPAPPPGDPPPPERHPQAAPLDGGTTPLDGGAAPLDGGAAPQDGGTAPQDGGTAPQDGPAAPPEWSSAGPSALPHAGSAGRPERAAPGPGVPPAPLVPPGGPDASQPHDAPAAPGRRTFDVAGPDAPVPPQVIGAPPVVGPPAATAPPVASAPLLGAPASPAAGRPAGASLTSPSAGWPADGSPGPSPGFAPGAPFAGGPSGSSAAAGIAGAAGVRGQGPAWVGLVAVAVVAFVVTQVVAVAAGEVVDGLGARRAAYAAASLLALGGLVVGAGPRLGSTRRAAVVAAVVWVVATAGLFLR